MTSCTPNSPQKAGPVAAIPSHVKGGKRGYGKAPPGRWRPGPALPLAGRETAGPLSSRVPVSTRGITTAPRTLRL